MINGDPHICDFGPQYKLDDRIKQTSQTMFNWAIDLSDRQHRAKKTIIHKGLLIACVDVIDSKVAHVRRLPGPDRLKEQTLYVPINMGLTDDVYKAQATAFYRELEGFDLHKTDGAIVIARDRLVLGSRIKILDVDNFDEKNLPDQCGLRHTAAQAGSELDNFLWTLVLGEETNDVRLFSDGKEVLNHTPGKKVPTITS